MNNTSWRPEVLVRGRWSINSLRFATEAEAKASAEEHLSRCFVPDAGRAAKSNDPVNYRFDFEDCKNIPLN